MPVRDDALPYTERVDAWHDEIARRWERGTSRTRPMGRLRFLVWGDPGLYDSTLRIAERLTPTPRCRVIPGITALQALTSAHAIPFNTIGGTVVVTTGRRLRDRGWPDGAETVAVMLDGDCSFQGSAPTGSISGGADFWGCPNRASTAVRFRMPARGSWRFARSCAPPMAGSWTHTSCGGWRSSAHHLPLAVRSRRRNSPFAPRLCGGGATVWGDPAARNCPRAGNRRRDGPKPASICRMRPQVLLTVRNPRVPCLLPCP